MNSNTKKSFSTKELYQERINQLWDNNLFNTMDFGPIINRGYAIQDEILINELLFIGINPSFKERTEETNHRIFYQNSHGAVHPYFKKFIDISEKTKKGWSHIDLLFIRETNQKIVGMIAKSKNGYDFCKAQYLISKEIIELAKPKVIIVNNTLAREWLTNKNFNTDCFECRFDQTIGTYRIVNNSILEDIPIFFTSMLTGQRALDNGSYERLIWHINLVLDKL